MNLLTLKTQNPGSFYGFGDIYSEDGNTILATNVDEDLDELSGTIEVVFGPIWDEDDRECRTVGVLGHDLAYALLGTQILFQGCYSDMIEVYRKDLWTEIRKGELCLQ